MEDAYHMFSIEILYHFRCLTCKNWWSIGDYKKQKLITCPHCKIEKEIKEMSVLNLAND